MGNCVCAGATLKCSFGTAPGTFLALPTNRTNATKKPAATIMDNIPMMNILPFSQCTSPTNPLVIAAFGAPSACIPLTLAPWTPGSPTVKIGKLPALDDECTVMCSWGGVIEVNDAGQSEVSIDN